MDTAVYNPLRQTRLLRPDYSARFRCIGGDCEDTCCAVWQVLIEPGAIARYEALPPSQLRDLILDNLTSPQESTAPAGYKALRFNPGEPCPLLSAQGLCRVHAELGPSYLCRVCAIYPRRNSIIDKLEETTLALSCPEAARLVLLDPNPLAAPGEGFYHLDWKIDETSLAPPRAFFWPIRELLLNLLRKRRYPLWQRLFLVGTFCRRLDQLAQEQPQKPIPPFLREFAAAVESGALRTAMERIPASLPLQIDLLLHLIHLRINDREVFPRFFELLREFVNGLGIAPDSSAASLTPAYAEAARLYLDPFLARQPQFLENLLINTAFRDLFPFGRSLPDPPVPLAAARAFARLATQFALIRGLLIGVAAHHRQAFGVEQALRTVQTAWKRFEHHPAYLEQSEQLLAARGVDNAQGLTMLIRD